MYHPDDVILISPTYTDVGYNSYQLKANEGLREIVTLNADDLPENNEIVLINALGSYPSNVNGIKQNISFRIFSPHYGSTNTVNFTLTAYLSEQNHASVTSISYRTGNFRGDGIERIIGIQPKSGYVPSVLYLFDLKTKSHYRYDTSFTMEESDRMATLDYDGDGKTDLYHFHKTGFDIYSFVSNNPASLTDLSFSLNKVASSTAITRKDFEERSSDKTGGALSGTWKAQRQVLFGDINGDGKIDILKTALYGMKNGSFKSMRDTNWLQVLSAGGGTFNVTNYSMPEPAVWINTENDLFMHDFNGDGCSDIVCMKGDKLQIIHSNGSRIDENLLNIYPVTGATQDGKLFTIGINYSNHNRVLGYIKNEKIIKLSIDRNEIIKSYLTSATTSHKVKTDISYQRIDDSNNNCYSAGNGAEFPFENYKGYFLVVSDVNKQFFNTKIQDIHYDYFNAVVHKQGLGFCGFERVSFSDKITDRSTGIIYDPTHFGIVKEVNSYNQKIENTYDLSYTGRKEPKFRLTNQKITDKVTSLGPAVNVTTISNVYDSYGNITKSLTQYGSDLTKEATVDYYNYVEGTSNKTRIGFPLNITTKVTRGSSAANSSTHHTYNAKQLPETTIEKANGKIVSQTSRVFDDFSNLIQESYMPYEATNKMLTSTFSYNSNGTKLTKSTNELGQTTEYVYSGDLLSSVKNFKGNIVRYEYDASRRVIKQTNPDNTITQTSYVYDSSGYSYMVTKTGTNRPTSKTQYDGLHRIVKEENQSISSAVYKKIEYDNRGRISRVSLPSFSSSPSLWDSYFYDSFDRLVELNYASGKKDTYSYNGNDVTSVVDGVTVTKTFDASGQLIKVKDQTGTITYNLRADGQPSSIVVPGNITTSFDYDEYGRKKTVIDPSAGTQSYTYDDSGNIKSEMDGNNKTISYTYDEYNRLKQKVRPEFTTTYSYNPDGLLIGESSSNGTSVSYDYDSYGRLTMERQNVDTKYLLKGYDYFNGNLSRISFSSHNGTIGEEGYTYTNGHLTEIKFSAPGLIPTSIWKLNSANEFGQPTGVKTGSFSRTYAYDSYGFPTARTAGYFQNFTYSFNANTGNLTYQKDNIKNYQENFTYDKLNRLTGCSVGGVVSSISYGSRGNIQKKDKNYFNHNVSGKPYALSSVSVSPNSIPLLEQSVSYTSFKRPQSIGEGGYTTSFVYDGSGIRAKMDLKKNGSRELTRYYFSDCYEIDDRSVGGIKEKLYLGGDYYSAPAVYVKDGSSNWQLYYICRDNLGSITHIASSNGSVIQQLSYDEWGQLRDWNTKEVYTPGTEPTLFLGRGYTGHEHLTQFRLINMNARLYDPAVGGFLSPDPYVQMPDFSQSYNRYSYCLNNPLKYTDTSGEFWNIAVGAAIGAYMGGVMANGGNFNPGKWDYNSGKTWGYMVSGAIVGGVSGCIGGAIAGSGIPMANTAGIASSSLINSAATRAYTLGQTPVSIGLGVASYDFTNDTFGYLGKKGNSALENIGYGLGAMANVSDILTGFRPQKIDLVTEHSDATGHSAIVEQGSATGKRGFGNPVDADPNGIISVGPNRYTDSSGSWHWMKGTNYWDTHSRAGEVYWRQTLNVNKGTITKYANWLNTREMVGGLTYSVELSSCVTHTSRALNLSGIFNIGIHPYLLNAQMYLWSNGTRPWTFSYFLNQ